MQFKYKFLGLLALIVIAGASVSALNNSQQIAQMQKQNLSASISLFDWFSGKEEAVPSDPLGDIQAISARKCHRLGGVIIHLPDGTEKCVISGNLVASLPDFTSLYPVGTDVVGSDPVSISKKKCRRLGGIVSPPDLEYGYWYCILPVDSNTAPSPLNTYYDATIGTTEPITIESIQKEKKSMEFLLKSR